MICKEYKIVFVAVPKTGTRSIYRLLQENYGGVVFRDHLKVIPKEYKDYYSFVIKRNPYARLISYWWHIKNIVKKIDYELNDFLDLIIQKKYDKTHIEPQWLWYQYNRIDKILTTERLEREFNELTFIDEYVELPKRHFWSDKRKPWKEFLNEEIIEKINYIYRIDFEKLNFEKL